MSDDFSAPVDSLELIALGDAIGDDPNLRGFLMMLKDETNRRSNTDNIDRASSLLELIKSPFAAAASSVIRSYKWVADRLSDRHSTIARSKLLNAAAEKSLAQAEAIRKQSQSESELKAVELEQRWLEVEEMREKLKLHAIDRLVQITERLDSLGVRWKAEISKSGKLIVGFVKDPE